MRRGSKGGAVAFVIFFNLLIGIPAWLIFLGTVLGLIGCGAIAAFTLYTVANLAIAGSFVATGILMWITLIFGCLAFLALMYFILKGFFIMLGGYFRWNGKIVREGF